MNVENKTALLPESLHPMPPDADLPIRSTYLHEEALRELGARLAGGGPVIDSELDGLDFHARIDAIADTILKVYRITCAAQSAGETVTP
ncbi:MAG: hypothetical protein J0H60_17655, partial [Rhizobiales bacterium]|nr:hypothetical protein [Hyphomicrobiales bacterium]